MAQQLITIRILTILTILIVTSSFIILGCSDSCQDHADGERFTRNGCEDCICRDGVISCSYERCAEDAISSENAGSSGDDGSASQDCVSDADCGPKLTCPDGKVYYESGCRQGSCEKRVFAGGSPCFDEGSPR